MFRRFFISFLLLAFQVCSYAQIRVKSYPRNADLDLSVSVVVTDSLYGAALQGAAVRMVAGKDTLNLITGNNGYVSYRRLDFPADSVTIFTSYMGYKPRMDRVHLAKRSYIDITIGLSEDPQQLNAIIVKGDAVTMVMHGDTTVFNASAFSSMKGDVLRDLLQKLPGVEVRQDGISYQGKKIDRILFNGKNLFGTEIKDAMDMVLADEVKGVKVYSKDAVDDLEEHSTRAKEVVMDVHTWKPLEHVGELSLSAEAGAFSANGGDSGRESIAAAEVNVGSYSTGPKPRLSGSVARWHNKPLFDYPVENGSATISLSKDRLGKSGYRLSMMMISDGSTSTSGSTTEYFPSYAWRERFDTSSVTNNSLKRNALLSGTGYFRKGRNNFKIVSDLTITGNRNSLCSRSSSLQDLNRAVSDRFSADTTSGFSWYLKPGYDLSLKGRRKLSVIPELNFSETEGSGMRMDTSYNSVSREWLVTTLAQRSFVPSVAVKWTEPLGKKSVLVAGFLSKFSHESSRKVFTNVFSGATDLNNSRDFSNNQFSNAVTSSYTYGRMNDGVYLNTTLGVKDIMVVRDERMGRVRDWSENYFRPVVNLLASYASGPDLFEVKYNETESVPSVEQLRDYVDDTEPLFLRAGNPELRLPVSRSLNLKYGHSVAEKATSLLFAAEGSITSRAIATRTTYFREETVLDNYGSYIAAAGSCLMTPLNVSGSHQVKASARYERYLSKSGVKLSSGLTFENTSDPFFTADVLHRNTGNSILADARAMKYSEKMTANLQLSCAGGRYSCDGSKVYDYLRPRIQANIRSRFAERFEFSVLYNMDRMFTTDDNAGYSNRRIDADVSWLFGKDYRCKLTLFGYNLNNSVKGFSETVTDDFRRHSYDNYLGRPVGMSFRYVFSRR